MSFRSAPQNPGNTTKASSSDGRLAAFGNQLIAVHVWLREELDALRADVDDYVNGRTGKPALLQAHCLTFCSALSKHHDDEEHTVFGVLGEEFPELGPVLAELRRDHHLVTGAMVKLIAAVEKLRDEPDEATSLNLRTQVEDLAAFIGTHFGYEERKIAEALNTLGVELLPADVLSNVLPEDFS